MTPEGRVKALIAKLLAHYDIQPAAKAGTFTTSAGWFYAAVQGPLSVRGIPDFIGHYRGRFWAIEAKAPGRVPTGFQKMQVDAIRCSGGAVFVIDGEESLKVFEEWLEYVQFSEFLRSKVMEG